MTSVRQGLRELIRYHVTGPAVEAAEIGDDYLLDPDLDYLDAIHLSDGIWGRFGVSLSASRIAGRTVGELVAAIDGTGR